MINELLLLASLFLTAQTPTDTFIYNNSAEPESLDPHRMSAHNDSLLALQMFEGLVAYDKDYLIPKPAVAEKWDISKDGKTYTFTIRSHLKWSNGEPITLEQIRASLLRAMDPAVGNQNVQDYTDHIVGAAFFAANYATPQRKEAEEKLGIKMKGKNQIQIILTAPDATYMQKLCLPQFNITHPSMADPQSKAWRTPGAFISNGPYKFAEWKVNSKVRLEKNPYFRDAREVKINAIEALALTDENATLSLYRTKQLDWTGEASLSSVRVPSLRGDPDFRLAPYFGTGVYMFNCTRKPFTDARVRKAFSLAVNRAELTDKVMKGGQMPDTHIVPPGVKDYPYSVVPPLPFDKRIEEAQKLLAQAGYPDGKNFPKVTLLYNTQEQNHRMAQAVQQMWKKHLNVSIDLQNMEWKVFINETQAGRFDMARQSWIADFPDPSQLMDLYVTGSGNNNPHWSNTTFDGLMRKSTTMLNRKARMSELAKAEKVLLAEVPIMPLYHAVYFSLMSPRVQGFVPNMFGKYQIRYLSKK